MKLDAHHHLWNLSEVSYPWLQAKGEKRFFGDPSPIQRDYLLSEFQQDAQAAGMTGSVHIQVGAADALAEAQWIQTIAEAHPQWLIRQVAFCDLTSLDVERNLNALQDIPSVVGVRQIVGRAPREDALAGTHYLLTDLAFLQGLKSLANRGLSFDLQLLPELMQATANVLQQVPELQVALCHAGSPYIRTSAGIADYGKMLKNLSALPNLFCKISGLGMFDHNWTQDTVRPIFNLCLDQFGAERLMFGSNFPVDSLSSTYTTLIERHVDLVSGLTSKDQEAYWGETARSFYKFVS